MITLADALSSLAPGGEWGVDHNDGDKIIWLDDNPQPTDAEIQAEIVRLQDEYDNNQYQRDRVMEYPPIGDQLDALFHAGVFPADMAATIQAIKDKYPKE